MRTYSVDSAPKEPVKPFKTIDIALSIMAALITAVAMVAMRGFAVWSVAYWSPIIGAALLIGSSTYVLCVAVPRIWNCFNKNFGKKCKTAELKDPTVKPRVKTQQVVGGTAAQKAPLAAPVQAAMPSSPTIEDKTIETRKREFLEALSKENDCDSNTWIAAEVFSTNIALYCPKEVINSFLFRGNEIVLVSSQAYLSNHSFEQLIHYIGFHRDLYEKQISEALSREDARDIKAFERVTAVSDRDLWIDEVFLKVFKQKALGLHGNDELTRWRLCRSPIFKHVVQAMTQDEITKCLEQKTLSSADFEVFRCDQYFNVLDKMTLEQIVGLFNKLQPDSLAFKRMLAWFCQQSRITAQSFNNMKQQDLIVIYKKCRQEKVQMMQVGDKKEYRAEADWSTEELKKTTEVTNGLARILLDNFKMQFFQGKLLIVNIIIPDVIKVLSVDELYEHKDKLRPDHYGNLTTGQFEGWANRATFADLWSVLRSVDGTKTHLYRVLAYICSNKGSFEGDVTTHIEQLSLEELDQLYKRCSVNLYAGKDGKICALCDLPRDMSRPEPVQDLWVKQSILQGIKKKFAEIKDDECKEKFKKSPWFAEVNEKG